MAKMKKVKAKHMAKHVKGDMHKHLGKFADQETLKKGAHSLEKIKAEHVGGKREDVRQEEGEAGYGSDDKE
jgi:hypothetical protein